MTAEDEPQEQQAAVEERQEGSMMIEEPLNEPRSEKSKETPVEPRDETAENSSESSSEGKSGSGGGYSADCSASDQSSDEKTAENGGMKVSIERLSLRDEHKRSQRKGRKKKSSHNKEHYSSPGKADSLEKDSDENDDYDDVDEDNHALHQKPPASSDIQALATDIAALQSQMQRWYQENALMLQGNGPLPQWNGVRIAHPMDPRIDLSTVSHVALQPGVPVNLQLNSTNQTAQTLPAHGPPTGNERTDGAPEHFGLPTMESYMHLMEIVRPFFHPTGVPVGTVVAESKNENGSQEEVSSEGFTSFFTTTHSSANQSSSANNSSSDADKKVEAHQFKEKPTKEAASGSSSMAVLARSKKKKSEPQEEDTSSSSRERRVRIQEAPNARAGEARRNEGEDGEQPQESSSSFSSSEQERPVEGRRFGVPPRIVTDVSSSNRTDSAGSNTNSGSGTGSAGNSGSGSGSNQGSSGSGNDNDGRGSSEEITKEDNSGEGTNEGSDGASSDSKKLGIGLDSAMHRHEPTGQDTIRASGSEDHGMQEDDEAARERKLLDKKRKRIEMRREYEAQQQSESSDNTQINGDFFLRPGKPTSLDQVLQCSKIPRVVIQATPPFLVVHTNAAYCRLTGTDSHKIVGRPVSSLLSVPEARATSAMRPAGPSEPRNEADVPDEHGSGTEGLQAAADAGRARASQQNMASIALDRLIAGCGFGRMQFLQAHAETPKILGKDVTVIQGTSTRTQPSSARNRDEGSNDTSLTSDNNANVRAIKCLASIAPIMSSHPSSSLDVLAPSESDASMHQTAKRRKVHGGNHGEQVAAQKHPASNDHCSFRRHHGRQAVTHYVIQLQAHSTLVPGRGSEESISSSSSSVEARLLGLTKSELMEQRMAIAAGMMDVGSDVMADEEAAASESTESTREPLSAIG